MSTTRRLTILVVPYAIFLAALLPWPGLLTRALTYQSTNNYPLWSAINVSDIVGRFGATRLMGAAMLLVGLAVRRRGPVELLCVYCVALVAFSAACANHYLVIPVIGLACAWKERFGCST